MAASVRTRTRNPGRRLVGIRLNASVPIHARPIHVSGIRSGIGIMASCRDAGLRGYAILGSPRQRISPGVIRVARGGRFRVDVFFHVDAEGMPRPLPFPPPQVGLQWSCTPDGGVPTDTAVFWDPGPIYRGAGDPLLPNFDNTVGFAVPESGWLTLSARIDDHEGAVEFDDTIRLLVA